MRVSTAFNTMLAIPGASVTGVRFEPSGVVVGLRLRPTSKLATTRLWQATTLAEVMGVADAG